MKKILSVILVFCAVLNFACIANANKMDSETNPIVVSNVVETYEDGSYAVITVSESISSSVRGTVKSGTKTTNYYSDNDTLLWRHIQHGTFDYTYGVSSVCTSASYSHTIYNDSWSLKSGKAWIDGNSSEGTATFVKKVLFVTTKTVNVASNLRGDIYGNLS